MNLVAEALDKLDRLACFRTRFHFPQVGCFSAWVETTVHAMLSMLCGCVPARGWCGEGAGDAALPLLCGQLAGSAA